MSKKIKDATYEIVDNMVVLTLATGEKRSREIVLGESSYRIAYNLYNNKNSRDKEFYAVYDYYYKYNENKIEIYNNNKDYLVSIEYDSNRRKQYERVLILEAIAKYFAGRK